MTDVTINPTTYPSANPANEPPSPSKINILTHTDNISHSEWLSYRNLGIGGSDASVVCGINRWKTPIQLYMEKKGMLPPQEAGEAAYWGNRLEDLVKEEFTLRTGIEVIPVNAILQNEDYPFMLANLDGICEHPDYGEVVFEAKTAGFYRGKEWTAGSGSNNNNGAVNSSCSNDDGNGSNGNISIPDEYMLQLQHYMAVTGFKGAYIAVLIGGNDFRWQFVERDEELIEMLIELELEFWEELQLDIPPDLDGSDASVKFINEYFPNSIPESTIQLPRAAVSLVEQYHSASEKIDYYTEQKQEAENLLKKMMGDNEVGIVGGNASRDDANSDYTNEANGNNNGDIIITWKSFTQERLDTKAIKSDHPTLCSRYNKEITSRRFSVKSVS